MTTMFSKAAAEAMTTAIDVDLALVVYRLEHPGVRIYKKSFKAGFLQGQRSCKVA